MRRSVIACMREVIPAAVCDRGSGVVLSSSAAKHRKVTREMSRQKRMMFLGRGMVGCCSGWAGGRIFN